MKKQDKKLNIALIMGGTSDEREVSLASGAEILRHLSKNKYHVLVFDPKYGLAPLMHAKERGKVELAYITLHGKFGEDGAVQGFLELIGLPYTGSGLAASANAMDKCISKAIYDSVGILTPQCRVLNSKKDKINIKPPFVVKPHNNGSSIGVSIVKNQADLKGAIDLAFKYSPRVILEEYVKGTEITGAALGNTNPKALPLVEICPKAGFFDYKSKYVAGETEEIVPARLSLQLTKKAQQAALAAHEALSCRGVSRTDMIVKGNDVYVLETNTLPGMTQTSLLPKAAAAAGISYEQLLDRLINLGLEKPGATNINEY